MKKQVVRLTKATHLKMSLYIHDIATEWIGENPDTPEDYFFF